MKHKLLFSLLLLFFFNSAVFGGVTKEKESDIKIKKKRKEKNDSEDNLDDKEKKKPREKDPKAELDINNNLGDTRKSKKHKVEATNLDRSQDENNLESDPVSDSRPTLGSKLPLIAEHLSIEELVNLASVKKPCRAALHKTNPNPWRGKTVPLDLSLPETKGFFKCNYPVEYMKIIFGGETEVSGENIVNCVEWLKNNPLLSLTLCFGCYPEEDYLQLPYDAASFLMLLPVDKKKPVKIPSLKLSGLIPPYNECKQFLSGSFFHAMDFVFPHVKRLVLDRCALSIPEREIDLQSKMPYLGFTKNLTRIEHLTYIGGAHEYSLREIRQFLKPSLKELALQDLWIDFGYFDEKTRKEDISRLFFGTSMENLESLSLKAIRFVHYGQGIFPSTEELNSFLLELLKFKKLKVLTVEGGTWFQGNESEYWKDRFKHELTNLEELNLDW